MPLFVSAYILQNTFPKSGVSWHWEDMPSVSEGCGRGTYKKTTTSSGNPKTVLKPHLLTRHSLLTLFSFPSSGNLTLSNAFPTPTFLLRRAIHSLSMTPRLDLDSGVSNLSLPSSSARNDTIVACVSGGQGECESKSSRRGLPASRAAIVNLSGTSQ
jgi:hypothetical protein